MTGRLIIEQTHIRSETIRTRLQLLLDEPPFRIVNHPTVQPASRAVIRVPRLDSSVRLGETENDR